ncbi:hypothetical protein B0O80DRAFT_38375 [Mortierella sp. GBAus27b]|nr:hypothetical protein B0O80DRAFT_38375 [Mortierella sp. GBAus27b]
MLETAQPQRCNSTLLHLTPFLPLQTHLPQALLLNPGDRPSNQPSIHDHSLLSLSPTVLPFYHPTIQPYTTTPFLPTGLLPSTQPSNDPTIQPYSTTLFFSLSPAVLLSYHHLLHLRRLQSLIHAYLQHDHHLLLLLWQRP